MKKVRVYYDREGQIVSVVEVKMERGNLQASIDPIPDTNSSEIELTGELAEMPLIDFHTKCEIDLKERKPILRQIKTLEPKE